MVFAIAAVALLAPPAAAEVRDPTRSSLLWATVNICDTARHPNAIGVRASMPGTRRRGHRMVLRIRVEYKTPGGWRRVGRAGDSGELRVGSGWHNAIQIGRTFTYRAGSSPLRFRAVVAFAWRRGLKTVYRASRITEAGHPQAAAGDPTNYSAATCVIS
jgi:hypothetical protein